jgi:hypothetical protein
MSAGIGALTRTEAPGPGEPTAAPVNRPLRVVRVPAATASNSVEIVSKPVSTLSDAVTSDWIMSKEIDGAQCQVSHLVKN